MPVFVVLVLLLLSVTSISLYLSNKKALDLHIGNRATEVYSVYQKAEDALLYIDKSAEYSFYKSISQNMNNLDTNCGAEEGYTLLVLGEDTCFLDDNIIKVKFEVAFNKYISEYLNLYKDLNLKDIKYNLDLDREKVNGKSDKEIVIEDNNIKYTIKPSFMFKNSFDVKKAFMDANNEIKKVYVLCKSDKSCWDKNLNKNFSLKNNGKFFMLDIDTGYKYGINKEKLILKFGLDFETNPLFR